MGQNNGTIGSDISLTEAWTIETGDSSVIVAINDGGVDWRHEDLAGNMWVNPGEIPGNNIDDDNNGYIDDIYGYDFALDRPLFLLDYHGTHVAGIVAAETNNGIGVAGVAGGSGNNDGVRIMSCAVFCNVGFFNTSGGFEEAFTYAADNGAVISQNSWTYDTMDIFEQSTLDAIDYFIAEAGSPLAPMDGGVVFFSTGNSGESGQWWPGCYEPVVAVAATNNNDVKTIYSNYDTWVDISAPGGEYENDEAPVLTGILSTLPNDEYGFDKGTSVACPHVSGVAALIVSHYTGNITPQEVIDRLINTTDPIDSLNPNFMGQLGSGRLNAYAALSADFAPSAANYCNSKGINSGWEWIARVDFGTFSNSSEGNSYSDFTDKVIKVIGGRSYSITLTPGFRGDAIYNEYWKIWIDYNNDTTFSVDELVYDSEGLISTLAVEGTITIPSDIIGTRMMRVSMKYDGEQGACEIFSYGEVEDYYINILPGVDTVAPSEPTNVTSSSITDSSFILSWNASNDNVGVIGYDIFKDDILYASTTGTNYIVKELNAFSEYLFCIKAKDAAGNVSFASNSIIVTTLNSSSYCESRGYVSSDEWIEKIDLGAHTISSGNNAGYKYFSSESIVLDPGSSVNVLLTPGFPGNESYEYWKIWIDYNNNKIFDDSELEFAALNYEPVNGTINIPLSASGTVRMRVSMKKYSPSQNACEIFDFGEVEDYNVTFNQTIYDIEAPSAPANVSLSNITETTFILSWYSSTDNVGVTGYDIYKDGTYLASTTSTDYLVSDLRASSMYSFYIKAKDAAGNVSTASNSISITTHNFPNYCESKGLNSSKEWIDYVQLNEINNTTGDNDGYEYFTQNIANVSPGSTQTIYFSCNFENTNYIEFWNIWIDWDQIGRASCRERV